MAKRLTKLQVDEVSVVDKAANNKRFLILKSATTNPGSDDPESIRKAGRRPLFGRAKREQAGTSGPTDGGIDMTPEDIRKAVTEAGEEILAPLDARIAALEAVVAKTAETPEATEPLTEEGVAKILSDVLAPFAARIEAIESVSGIRKSGMDETGAHTVQKSDGSFSWQGSGLLL